MESLDNKEEVFTDKAIGWKESRLLKQTQEPEKAASTRAVSHKYRDFLFPSGDNFTAEDVLSIYQSQDGECISCYVDFTKEPYEIDHKISLKMGGNNTADNIQLLCKSCNVQKNDMDYHAWLSRLKHKQVTNYLNELAEGGF